MLAERHGLDMVQVFNAMRTHARHTIPDKAHARNALARVAQHGTAREQKKVRKAGEKRYPSLKNKD